MINDIVMHVDGEGRRRKHIVLACETCGVEFPKPLRFAKRRATHFCSPKCVQKSRKTRAVVNCDLCGAEFERKPSQKSRTGLAFCSRRCKEMAQRSDYQILQCGYPFGGAAGYRERALQHYGSKCEWCGYDFERLLDVHHIDRDRANGTVENLIVLCVFCHALDTRNLVRVGAGRGLVIVADDFEEQIRTHFESRGISLEVLCESKERVVGVIGNTSGSQPEVEVQVLTIH